MPKYRENQLPDTFSCPEQLNRRPCPLLGPLVCLTELTIRPFRSLQREWSHTRVTFGTFDQSDEETWHDQKRSTYLHTYIPTYLPTYLVPTYLETCDLWDIWSEWWGDMTWLKKSTYLQGVLTWHDQKIYLSTYLTTLENTCDNWDIWSAVMIWHLGYSLMEQS